jgi:HK97 family phage prohead protease
MNKHEQRSIRTSYDKKENKLWGYAAIFDTPTEIRDYGRTFTEVVRRGAFQRTLKENKDIICTFNHDTNRLLGRTSSQTLTIREDKVGLYFEVALSPDIETHREVRELALRGDLLGASFTFTVPKEGESWASNTRELKDLDLYELGPVVLPAYKDTKIGMRSNDRYRYKLLLREKI